MYLHSVKIAKLYNADTKQGIIVDPTIRFEVGCHQSAEVHLEKKSIYEPTVNYFKLQYALIHDEVFGLLMVRDVIEIIASASHKFRVRLVKTEDILDFQTWCSTMYKKSPVSEESQVHRLKNSKKGNRSLCNINIPRVHLDKKRNEYIEALPYIGGLQTKHFLFAFGVEIALPNQKAYTDFKIAGYTAKNKKDILYPNVPSAIRAVPHGPDIPVPLPPEPDTLPSGSRSTETESPVDHTYEPGNTGDDRCFNQSKESDTDLEFVRCSIPTQKTAVQSVTLHYRTTSQRRSLPACERENCQYLSIEHSTLRKKHWSYESWLVHCCRKTLR
ncbi:hypothetical protein ANN_08766 [Periplaneta americana]|uniref:Uncharacterized protein n=1 Tax=Periplaneta americana TaxID=6978 RepID=A0ABQ8T2B3_PERAM|nr:hypothetical protein ANN_08766 [Periplaneta americana]